jgi:hypothetical protein
VVLNGLGVVLLGVGMLGQRRGFVGLSKRASGWVSASSSAPTARRTGNATIVYCVSSVRLGELFHDGGCDEMLLLSPVAKPTCTT